jgi:hypothetical protein
VVNALAGFIGGGNCNFTCNSASGCFAYGAVVVGGVGNNTTGGTWDLATCVFTVAPTACNAGIYSFVGGGFQNRASFCHSAIVGGQNNYVSGNCGFIGGGINNTAGARGVAVGGDGNVSCTLGSLVGGLSNSASGDLSVVGGGQSNTASGSRSTEVGGRSNTASAYQSFVGGGGTNTASGQNSTIVGGQCNTANGACGVIGGGNTNTASGGNSAILGGAFHTACNTGAAIVGGSTNVACGAYSFVGGGVSNTASGTYSAILGGCGNTASNSFSGAFGCNLTASAACTFYTNNSCACGSMYATSFFETSDIRYKNIHETYHSFDTINTIKFSWKTDNAVCKYGYAAQNVCEVLPSAVHTDTNEMLQVDYTQVHTWKLLQLEKRIAELERMILKNGI